MSMNPYWERRKKQLEELDKIGKARARQNALTASDDEDIAPVKQTKDNSGLFKAGRFDDGYQFGDVLLSLFGTVGDAASGIVQGAGNLVEGVSDLILYGASGVSDLVGADSFADDLKRIAQEEGVNDFFDNFREDTGIKDSSFLGDFGYGVAQGVGQVGAIIATGGIAGAAGLGSVGASVLTTGLMGASSMGSGMSEAYNSGATDGEAVSYGVMKGVVDAGTELIFGGLGKGVKALGVSKGLSSLDDVFAKKLSSKISSQFWSNAAEYGVKATAEGVEEVLAGLGSAAAKKLTYMSDEELTKLIEDENLLEQFASGVIVSGIAQGGDLIKANKQGRDFVNNLTANEEKVVEAEFESLVAEAEKNGKELTKKQKNELYEYVQEQLKKGYISTDTIESVLGGDTYKSYKDTIDSEDAILNEFEELGKKQNATLAEQSRYAELQEKVKEINGNSNRSQLKSQLSNEVYNLVKEKDGYLAESYNERARRSQAYEADLTKYDAKQQEVIKKAAESGILNNTRRTHEFVDLIAKISADKGVLFDFTDNAKLKESGFAIDGKTVNGYVTKDGVTLNIQSAKALNSVVGHEIAHVLEGTELYTELQNAVMEYAKTKKDFDGRHATLTELYKDVDGADINAELTADLVGDYLFTDPDFINNLSVKHRNVFQKIYDEIKYLYKVATAGSKEARQLEQVKRAFDKAYRESGKANADTKYSLEQVDGIDYVKAEKNIFVKEDGSLASEREVFNSLAGKTIHLPDGDVKIVKRLPDKDMYNELSKRYPKQYNGVEDIKQLNSDVNYNMEELIGNSEIKKKNVADEGNRHARQGISSFDTRTVKFYDGSKVYDIEFSIATLQNGEKIAYAKKYFGYDAELTKKIQTAEVRSKQSPLNQRSANYSISQNSEKSIGNEKNLSAEQQEYFKDSVVRDDNGELKVMYHGTSKGGHTVFDTYGSNYGLFGQGSYFTDDKSVAESYTKKGKGNNPQVYESYLNIKNPMDMDAEADPKAWAKAFPDATFPESGTNEDFYRAMEEYFQDEQYSKWEAAEEAMESLMGMGYDGITHIGGGRVNADGKRHQVYIAFHPEQIKNIDNAKPTDNPDIRYSLSDSEGNKLTKEQSEYFKDSKAVDRNGNLLKVYHTTNNDFTVFDKSKKGEATGDSNTYLGFFFADDAEYMQNFPEFENGKTEAYYLNMTNPIDMTDISKEAFLDVVEVLGGDVDEAAEIYDQELADEQNRAKLRGDSNTSLQLINLLNEMTGDADYRTFIEELKPHYNELMSKGYDGVVNYLDELWGAKEYVVLDSNQAKLTTNLKPTSDPDIRFSLSAKGEQPKRYGKYNVMSEDVRLETAPTQEDIAPVREDISQTETATDILPDDLAPMAEGEVDSVRDESFASIDDSDAPPEMEAPYYGESEDVPPDNPFENRDIKEVGSQKVKAYMYENPEVKPYFQAEANVMLGELRDTVKGERWYNDEVYYETNGEAGFGGTSRHTTQDIAYLLDNLHYSYAEIEKGLKAIIEDHGEENNACSKRIEFLINDRLMNGYQDISGYDIPSNQDYIKLLNEKQITEYSEEARKSFFASADDYAPIADDDIAPTKEFEAIKPRPEKLEGEEAQWAKNKMARADKVNTEEQQTAEILETEPETKKKSRGWSHFVRNFVDKQHVFETLSLKKHNRELMAKADQMHRAESSAQYFIGHGAEGVKSLNDIRSEVESTGLKKQFYEYLYHKHNVDRMNLEGRYKDVKNKPVFGYDVTAEKSQDIVNQYEFAEPRFKEYAQDVYDYMNHLRKKLVDNGVISQETADLWAEMYPHYVPIRRVGDSGLNINVPLDTGRTGVNAPIKQATGGNRDILPLFDTMAMRTQQTFKAIAKNNFGVELKNTLGTGVVKNKVNFEEVVDSIEKHDELLQKGENGRNPTFTVFENGERVTFEITEDMYDALKPTSEGLAYTNKALNTVNNIRRGLITEYNPVFMATNAIKDAQDILINSQHAAKTYATLPKAFKELATKGKWYTEYMENGGESNTYFDGQSNTFKKEDNVFKKVMGMPLRAISKANNFIERAPRLAEYIASRESGASVEVAMLDAARVTTNFAAGGDVTKFLNRNGATFLNASVQGAMQQVRNIREAKANGLKGLLGLAGKFALAGLPALLLNHLLWEDDEDYEDLSDYVKDNYYVVAKYGDGQFVRIPKGRTVAVIQDAIEQVGNFATGNDEADFKSFGELVLNNLAPNNPLDNNIISPIIQAAQNKTWYGEDLVPTRLQDLPAEEQYDESTDAISKWLGENTGFSPYKINYLLDQYGGGLGDVFLPMFTPEAESGDNSFFGNVIAPLKDKFTTDSVMNNQNVSDFYSLQEELATNAKKSSATDEDVLRYKYINSVSSDLGKLYAQKREVQNSNLKDDAKYSSVREIQKKIDSLAENSLNDYKDVYIEDGYAVVGDRYYRLNDKGEWVKISDNQLEDQDLVTSALGISGSEYWRNKNEYDFAYEYPEKYSVAKAVGGYNAYKSFVSDLYDIKADKDENGKSISGSRKEKVIEYINNLDGDYGEKIIMFKSVYNADDTYNEDIVEYLNSRSDISYDEMVAILKELGFTVYSDGTVKW